MTEGLRVTLCVDALRDQLGGIGRYTWELARRLPSQAGVGQVGYYVSNRLIDDPKMALNGSPIYRGRGFRRLARTLIAKRRLQTSLVHAPNYFLPRGVEQGIVTIHDLSVFRFPETHPKARVQQFERLFEDSLSRSAHVITDTETVRAELMDAFNLSGEMVSAVPLGVGSEFRPADEASLTPLLGRLGLEYGRYGLCVSAVEPRKKISELLTAWRELPLPIRNRFPLVLAGGSGWMNEGIHDQLEHGASESWIRHLGHVQENELAAIYAGATVFVYPSVYEGFGLPPIEAMASGVPVIVSHHSCLPEVCGDAARYVDPDDIAGMTDIILDVIEDRDGRPSVVRKGLERARQFTWDRCVQDTVGVYRKVGV